MQVRVPLRDRPYTVHVGAGVLAQVGEIACRAVTAPATKAFIVADSGVPHAVVAACEKSLADRSLLPVTTSVTPTERNKTWGTLQSLLSQFAQARLDRSDLVIALGGGIVGDVAGFAAAVYRRGIPVVQCPTTLLAMVDASVGGKTGINLDLPGAGLMKNMVGSFWQPVAVIADIEVLRSLPAREFRAGLAECIKHGLISAHADEPGLLDWTAASLDRFAALEPSALSELVHRNVSFKARIVQGDEREEAPDQEGGRALLNLGHTFGHAIETLPNLSPDQDPSHAPLLHGEAVALGLVAATACSASLGLCPTTLLDEVRAILTRAGLPTRVAGLPPDDALITIMGHDKKARGGSMRLVLPLGGGRARVVSDPPRDAIAAGIAAMRG
jgi:3-dehydroquinate synthase